MQKDLLRLSNQSWHTIIEKSGHNIYHDAPKEVIDNILKVVGLVRNS